MKAITIIGLGTLTIAGLTYYNNFVKGEESGSFSGSGGGVIEILGLNGQENTNPTIPNDPNPTIPNDSNEPLDFKMSILQQDYNSHKRSGSKKSRKYIESPDFEVIRVQDDGATVGGYDFKNGRSVTAKEAERLSKGGDNPSIIKLGSSKKSKNYTPAPKKEEKKKSAKSFFSSIGVRL